MLSIVSLLCAACSVSASAPFHRAELVFPLHPEHNHAPGIVECPNGDLLVSWYRGKGERRADDVAVYGARLRNGASTWSQAFLMVDTPNFPDCNTTMFIDADDRLWLFWPTILDNTWDSCLTHYLVSEDYLDDGPITWNWHDVILLAPKDFPKKMLKALSARIEVEDRPWPTRVEDAKRMQHRLDRIGDKLFNRLGWQPRCKPTVLPSGRILLPLYSDTYDASIMAVSDDRGKSWYASDPLIGFGNIQPTVLRRKDGTLVAYMRENGPLDRIRTCASADDGITWGTVGVSDLPNPGAGVDGLVLESGKWLLIYNDTTRGRSSLAVSLSGDEGKTWKWTRHLEKHESGAYHYPAIIQGRDETLHAVYSYFVNKDGKEGKSMKHAAFNEAWIMGDDD